MRISAIIVTKNEEKMLSECLKTLKWADEIIVLDTGSVDKTLYIAKKAKAKVIEYKGKGSFSDWRNYAARKAKGDWLLYVDADERIPNSLKKEIFTAVSTNNSSIGCYAIPRKNIVLGKELVHGGWYPDYVKRLVRKSSFIKWEGELHENPTYNGKLEHLEFPMIHVKHETISEMIEKTNKWSEVEGKLMYDAGHPPMTVVRFISAAMREFWQRMIIHRAFMDGPIGIIFAMYQVFSRFVSYAKLWELQVTNESSDR